MRKHAATEWDYKPGDVNVGMRVVCGFRGGKEKYGSGYVVAVFGSEVLVKMDFNDAPMSWWVGNVWPAQHDRTSQGVQLRLF